VVPFLVLGPPGRGLFPVVCAESRKRSVLCCFPCSAGAPMAFHVRAQPGMGVYRFEDLRVWQAAKSQCDRVGELINRAEFRRDLELSAQMNDASISVMNNISEGFVRRRNREMTQFLRYSAGSNGEVRSCFYAAHGRKYLADEEVAELLDHNDAIGRMLRRWLDRL
jgi:four helix bundle protein